MKHLSIFQRVDILLLILVWIITIYHSQGRQCLEGFISTNTLREKSLLLGGFSQSPDKAQWIFPYLNFSCAATISSFRVVAEDRGNGKEHLTFQVWRPQNAFGTEFEKIHERTSNLTPIDRTGNPYRSSTVTFRVQRGDILGIYQPQLDKSRFVMYFQTDSGMSSYRIDNQRDPPDDFRTNGRNVDSDIHAYPLIGVLADPPECVSPGFLTVGELTVKASLLSNPSIALAKLTEHGNQRRLVKGLSFGCNGVLNSVTFTAKPSTGLSYPKVQIWRRQLINTSVYTRQSQATLANLQIGDHLNTLTVSFPTPLVFQQDDILGFLLPQVDNAALLLQFLQSGQNPDVTSFPESYSTQSFLSDQFLLSTYFTINANAQRDNDLPLMTLDIVADCGSPLAPTNGMVLAPSTKADSFATYRCNEGFQLVGEWQRQCQAQTGIWSREAPFCEAVDCGPLPPPEHGTITYENTTYQSEARYSCDRGFTLTDGSTSLRNCTFQGSWSHQQPQCTGLDCQPLAVPNHGRVIVEMATQETQVDAVAQYICDTNYTLLGVNSRTCLENQSWTGESPVCVADCMPPPPIPNGSVQLSGEAQYTSLYTVATYTCKEGYKIRPDNGNNLICGESSKWIGELPMCEVVTCDKLQQPEFGHVSVTNGTQFNSAAYYNCTYGYRNNSTQQRMCSSNGTWTGNESICLPPLPTIIDVGATKRPLSDLYLAIVVIIALLTVVILILVITITVLCIKRRKYKAMEMNMAVTNINDTSLNNPVYEGDQRFSFNLWNPNLSWFRQQFGKDSTPESSEAEQNSIYEQPIQPEETLRSAEQETRHLTPRLSLHYEVSSIINPSLRSGDLVYDEPEGNEDIPHHYDTASNYKSSQYEMPASPYEIPTPTSKVPNIYNSLPWGTYVPTEEQRRSTSSPLPSPLELSRKSQSKTSLDQVFFAESEVYWKPASDSASLYEQLAKNRYREILREQIQITAHLGSGQFGTVDKGLWQSPLGVKEVAIKTLKTDSTETDRVKFLQEAAINGQFQHENIVKLHGVVTMGEPVMIVLELLANRDLRNYLIKLRPAPGELVPSDTSEILLKFCADIATGMMYLSCKAFIHRDLAARNILVTESKTCKIGDFGLSRDLEDESYYISHGGKIPVKWTAPEALHYKKYSTASDVWSFGCVMYEIWSLGHKPFRGCSNTQAISLIDRGFRLPPPPGCSREIYELMIHCWHPTTSLRPTFTELHQKLSNELPGILSKAKQQRSTAPNSALGGSLDTSKDFYPDLQNFHLPSRNQ